MLEIVLQAAYPYPRGESSTAPQFS